MLQRHDAVIKRQKFFMLRSVTKVYTFEIRVYTFTLYIYIKY